jgi:hypothetical protein
MPWEEKSIMEQRKEFNSTLRLCRGPFPTIGAHIASQKVSGVTSEFR